MYVARFVIVADIAMDRSQVRHEGADLSTLWGGVFLLDLKSALNQFAAFFKISKTATGHSHAF